MTSPDTRAQILAAAHAEFIEQGYGARMEAIARRAGVAKQTLYNHFDSKPILFTEVVREMADGIMLAFNEAASGLDLASRLTRFAEAARTRLFAADGIAFKRMLLAEAPRFPDEVRQVFGIGAGRAHQTLSDAFATAHARGELDCPDPAYAADVFLSMLTGFEHMRVMHGAGKSGDGDPARASVLVHTFMRAFAPAAQET